MLNTIAQQFTRKRTAAIALLAVAAIGAARLPGHRLDSDADRIVRTSTASDSDQTAVLGTNNLLGNATGDLDAPAKAAEVSQDHLGLAQADESMLLRQLRSLIASSEGATLNGAVGVTPASSLSASAVPEPATAGMLVALLVPALVRRRRGTNG